MKVSIYVLVGMILFTSCTKDYDVQITGVNFHPNVIFENFSAETEFLDDELLFGADFSMDPDRGSGSFFGPRVGEITHLNPVLGNGFTLTSNHDFLLSDDTLKSGENLMEYFEYKKLNDMFRLSYNFKSTVTFLNETGYYTFYFSALLSDNSQVYDSCLVRITF